MTHTEKIAAALGLGLGLAAFVAWLFHYLILAVWWWPWVGSKWRAERWGLPAWTGPDSPQSPVPVDWPAANPEDRTCCEHPGTGICMCDCHDWEDEPSSDADADEMIATWRGDDETEHEQLATVHPIYLDLSEDPDLIVWDAKQQASRCWEIVHIEFPRLRTELASMWEAAA